MEKQIDEVNDSISINDITKFLQYIRYLKKYKQDYLVLIAAQDTAYGPGLTKELADIFQQALELKVNLYGKFRCGYVAVLYRGQVFFEKLTPPSQEAGCSGNIGDLKIHVVSRGWNLSPRAIIEINGIDYAAGGRGLNFVIYSLQEQKVVNCVTFDTYSEVVPIKNDFFLREALQKWMEQNPDVTILRWKKPSFPTENLSSAEQFMKQYQGKSTLTLLDDSQLPLYQFYESKKEILEVLTPPKSYFDIQGVRKLENVHGKHFNTVNGHRVTTDQPERSAHTIYCIGGCVTCGYGASDTDTISSQLQRLCNEYVPEAQFLVENYGYYLAETDYHDMEELKILQSLPVKPGGVVITDWAKLPEDQTLDLLEAGRRPHDYGELFMDCGGHLCPNGMAFVAKKLFFFLQEKQVFTEIAADKNLKDTEKVLPAQHEQQELLDYQKQLQHLCMIQNFQWEQL